MIQLQNVLFSYKKQKPLFRDLSLQIPGGNIYGLLGRNGAGKTSLLRLITGLVFPKSGDIKVMGFRPEDRFPAFLSDIFFLPEEYDFPAMIEIDGQMMAVEPSQEFQGFFSNDNNPVKLLSKLFGYTVIPFIMLTAGYFKLKEKEL